MAEILRPADVTTARQAVADVYRTDPVLFEAIAATVMATCPECDRVFDLGDETEAAEFHYGHDCEV